MSVSCLFLICAREIWKGTFYLINLKIDPTGEKMYVTSDLHMALTAVISKSQKYDIH